MSASTIPSSSAVVTQASHPSNPQSPSHFLHHLPPLPRRLECLAPGVHLVRTNASVGRRCRWTPSCRRQAARVHWKEVCDAQVS
jgi:hypothetical protein